MHPSDAVQIGPSCLSFASDDGETEHFSNPEPFNCHDWNDRSAMRHLNQGSSLEEIGDVLRHQSRILTTKCARHDVEGQVFGADCCRGGGSFPQCDASRKNVTRNSVSSAKVTK